MPILTILFPSGIPRVNEENWNICFYHTRRHRAFISLGGDYGESDKINIIYMATVTNQDDQEIFQRAFDDLPSAIIFLNQTYGHWQLQDQTLAGGSCGPCHAH